MSLESSKNRNRFMRYIIGSSPVHIVLITISAFIIFAKLFLTSGYLFYADSIPFSLNQQSFNNLANYLYSEKLVGLLPNPVYILNSFFVHKLFLMLSSVFDLSTITVLTIFVPFLLQNIVIYYCFRLLLQNKPLSLLLSLLYMFSITSFDLLFTGGGPNWSNTGGFIFLVSFIKYLEVRKAQYLIYMIFASLLGVMNLAFFYCILIAFISYYLTYILIHPAVSFKAHASILKSLLLVGVGIVMINLYWILPLMSNQNAIQDNYMSDDTLLQGRSKLASPLKNFQFSHIYKIEPFFEKPYLLYNSVFYIAITFSFLLFALKKITDKASEKAILPLFVTFLFLFSISLGTNFMFWDILSQIPGWFFFRDPIRLVYLLYFLFLLLVGLTLKKKLSKFVKTLLICYLAVNSIIFIFSDIWGFYNKNELPNDYFKVQQYLSKTNNISKTVLILPEFRWYVRYLWMKHQYYLPNITEHLIANPLIMSFISRNRVPENFQYYFDKQKFSEEDIVSIGKGGVKFILVHKDIVLLQSPQFNNLKNITKILSGRNLTLYELKDTVYYPNIYANTPTVFKKINPTKYEINIKVSENSILIFNQPFNKNWKLYPGKYSLLEVCQNYSLYQNSKECYNDPSFFEGEEISYISNKPIFAESHTKFNNYSNSWVVNKNRLLQNLDKESYTINNDGSITVSLILYYLPQSYFYLGILCSFTTIVGLFIILRIIKHR